MQSFDTGNSGRVFTNGDVLTARRTNRRSLMLTAAVLLMASVALPAQQPGELSPELLKRLPPEARKQYERSLHPETAAPAAQAPKPAAPDGSPAGAVANPDAKSAVAAVQSAPPIGSLSLHNADLIQVVDQLARAAKINYILDPRVKGGVTLNTYGETKSVDPREMLETILRINGAAMVQTGDLFHIVPLVDLAHMPLRPESQEKDIADDERPMLNLVFLKYANVDDLGKLIENFLGPDGKGWTYPAANLLLVLDSRRNMRRLMEMVAMFDSDTLAKQRVRTFNIVNSRPSDLAREMDSLFKSISLSKDTAAVRFVPINRINTLIAVAANPGVFKQVEEWIKKLDVKVKGEAGKSDSYVYRIKYGKAETIAQSIMSLYYSMNPGMGMGMGGYGGYGMSGMGGYGMSGMGGYGMSGMGGYGMSGMGGYGMSGMGGYGMSGYGAGAYGGSAYGNGAYGAATGAGAGVASGAAQTGVATIGGAANAVTGSSSTGTGMDMTGSYLGSGYGMGMGMMPGSTLFGPRIMPNSGDNSLLILATPEQYESVEKLLQQIDVPPRQVLIEAQILEVTLTGAFSSGVSAWLQQQGATNPATVPGSTASAGRTIIGAFDGGVTTVSAGWLVGQSRQLFGLLTAQETSGRTKVVSTPRLIATDSIPASITVGNQVPTLASQAVTSAVSNSSSLFANTIQNVTTGTTLSFTARVNPSGVVTLQIDQQVSAPIAPAASAAIQSPSFSNREVKTQVTVQDGDMVAIGGIIDEEKTESTGGIPLLHRLPLIGGAFGTKSTTKTRTELVIFLTPHVIYDTNGLSEANEDLVNGMKRVQKLIRE